MLRTLHWSAVWRLLGGLFERSRVLSKAAYLLD